MHTRAHVEKLAAEFGADIAPSPCGADMSFSIEFDQINELRREDDASLDQGAWVTEIKRADWPAALALCEQLLLSRTKDLRVAAWWTEAAAHTHGFDGLANGVTLYAALCGAHWEAVHPLPEDGDQDLRIGSVSWLLAQCRALCRKLPLLQHGDLTLNLGEIEAARQRAVSMGASAQALAAPAADGRPAPITMDVVSRAQRATPAARIRSALDGVHRLPAALAELQTVIEQRLGADGPGFASVREAAVAAVSGIERLAREMGVLTSEASAPAPGDAAERPASQSDAGTGFTGGAPATRAQALAQLRQVAAFFRRTEPHSPVAYLADRAAHWGEMPLHQWLRAVVKEPGALSQIEELLGVEPGAPPEER
jgi:type VI secretion system protein ImpA